MNTPVTCYKFTSNTFESVSKESYASIAFRFCDAFVRYVTVIKRIERIVLNLERFIVPALAIKHGFI